MAENQQSKPMITDVFVAGARKGWTLATTSTLPNVLMAFVVIKVLELTGLLKLIGTIFAPVMGIFGVPGESAAVLLAGWMSMGGGVGAAATLFGSGVLNGNHLAIIAPALFLMGSQVQYVGRLLGVVGTRAQHIPVMIGISVLNAFGAMLVMRVLL